MFIVCTYLTDGVVVRAFIVDIQQQILIYFQPQCSMKSYTPCPRKKGATDFFAITFTNIDGFS